MNCNSCNNCGFSCNSSLWILLLALALCGKSVCLDNLFSGCTTPFLLALAYCLGKNGTLSNLFGGLCGNSCGCNC